MLIHGRHGCWFGSWQFLYFERGRPHTAAAPSLKLRPPRCAT